MGRLSLAVDFPCLNSLGLSPFDAGALADARIALQPGMHFLSAPWAIDELMSLYLTDMAPDQFTLSAGDVWLELRGSRGALRMTRLPRVDFVFRRALAAGHLLGDAALLALEVEPTFDPGRALLDLLDECLVVRIDARRVESAV